MPASAPLPTPTMSAAGVAIPRAQGHAMISTAMNDSTELRSPGTRNTSMLRFCARAVIDPSAEGHSSSVIASQFFSDVRADSGFGGVVARVVVAASTAGSCFAPVVCFVDRFLAGIVVVDFETAANPARDVAAELGDTNGPAIAASATRAVPATTATHAFARQKWVGTVRRR